MKKRVIQLKTPDDVKKIRDAGRIIADIFKTIKRMQLAGMSTWELDALIESAIHRKKARPAFKTVAGYSHSSCISVNNEVVHGVPSKKKIVKKGDIVKIDTGVVLNGFFGDACYTFMVDRVSEAAARLVAVARESLMKGIEMMFPGNRLGDIGGTIQEFIESNGYSVVRAFTGHGVGYKLHESPSIPHYGRKGAGILLQEGMVLAVEPMVNEGSHKVITLNDGWTAVTSDGKLSAQFEHTIAITGKGPVILTK